MKNKRGNRGHFTLPVYHQNNVGRALTVKIIHTIIYSILSGGQRPGEGHSEYQIVCAIPSHPEI